MACAMEEDEGDFVWHGGVECSDIFVSPEFGLS